MFNYKLLMQNKKKFAGIFEQVQTCSKGKKKIKFKSKRKILIQLTLYCSLEFLCYLELHKVLLMNPFESLHLVNFVVHMGRT